MSTNLATSSFDRFYKRIKEALRLAAPFPGTHQPTAVVTSRDLEGSIRNWLPPAPESTDAALKLLSKRLSEIKAELYRCEGLVSLVNGIKDLALQENWVRVALHKGPWMESCAEVFPEALWADEAYNLTDLEQCDVAITHCDAIIAQTGTVLISTAITSSRALSALPPTHIVLATEKQIVADLPAAFDLIAEKYGSAYPSAFTLITGPSRTADIERTLVLGAHGPRRLIIIIID
ncbi:MAG: lactate utilization protein [Methylacidiphilales bacterium]|nr:lactate utilization protein [Candidatus Methylacidiphilales bacterium]MDW8348676.1 lactate utilization protein [Verrucomicrobiae bacterium]